MLTQSHRKDFSEFYPSNTPQWYFTCLIFGVNDIILHLLILPLAVHTPTFLQSVEFIPWIVSRTSRAVNEVRTRDLRLGKPTLFQLSYYCKKYWNYLTPTSFDWLRYTSACPGYLANCLSHGSWAFDVSNLSDRESPYTNNCHSLLLVSILYKVETFQSDVFQSTFMAVMLMTFSLTFTRLWLVTYILTCIKHQILVAGWEVESHILRLWASNDL